MSVYGRVSLNFARRPPLLELVHRIDLRQMLEAVVREKRKRESKQAPDRLCRLRQAGKRAYQYQAARFGMFL